MIIQKVLDVLYNVFKALSTPINIPQFPSEMMDTINTALGYLQVGAGILSTYTHLSYLFVLFGLVLAVEIGVSLYHFVMFILKKIPFLGIE